MRIMPGSKTDGKTVSVFVRLGPDDDEDTRTVSFQIPEEIPQPEIQSDYILSGWAIDGNQVIQEVPLFDENWNLNDLQQWILAEFDKRGYSVVFK